MGMLYAIVGDPVAQVRSPSVFNTLFAQRGIDAEMVALEVRSADFDSVFAGLIGVRNFGGAVITVPHKLAAARLAASRSPRVEMTGAANVLRPEGKTWHADLFDGIGFVAGLRARGVDVAGMNAAVVGSGGAGLAIAAALLDAGAVVAISDLDPAKAELAATRLAKLHPGRITCRGPSTADDIAVNATPVGMQDHDNLPIDLDRLKPGALVAEAIMKPPVTHLLQEAARRGHPVQEGSHMLDNQVEAIWRFLEMGGTTGRMEA